MIVLVDARNALRSRWPNVPEDELVELTERWAHERDLRAIVIFDGRAPGELVGEREESEACVVVGTGAESADDWLVRKAAELARRRESYWLVTSDRALRGAAGGAAERTIGGGGFLTEIGAR